MVGREKEAHIFKSITNKAVKICCLQLNIKNNPCLEGNAQIACLGDAWKPRPNSEFVPGVVLCGSSLVHFEDPALSHQQTLVLATFSAKPHQISNVLEHSSFRSTTFQNLPFMMSSWITILKQQTIFLSHPLFIDQCPACKGSCLGMFFSM